MIDIDKLAESIVEANDDRTAVMARLVILSKDIQGRMTEMTHTVDFYDDKDYQFSTSVKPLFGLGK